MQSQGYAPARGAELFYRIVGEGPALVVIHGGPDFDHRYLRPGMDRLGDAYRLVYYDQRGRGGSRGEVRMEDIHIETYVEDLDALRRHLGLDRMAILGHSWGGVVAMHYALRHGDRLTRLVLLNSAPASYDDLMLVRRERLVRRMPHAERLVELTPAYEAGDPAAVAEIYRCDYASTFANPRDADQLDLAWTREQVLSGRAIEAKLHEGLIWKKGFDLLPELRAIRVPTTVIHGELDFVPLACDERIAAAIPGARLVRLPRSGHFSYVDAIDGVRAAIAGSGTQSGASGAVE